MAAITPINAGLPDARSALTVQRDWSEKKDPLPKQNSHTRHFLTSLSVQEKPAPPAPCADTGRWKTATTTIATPAPGRKTGTASADPHHALRLILKASPAL